MEDEFSRAGAPAPIAGDEKRRRRLGIRTWTYVPPRADVLGSARASRSARRDRIEFWPSGRLRKALFSSNEQGFLTGRFMRWHLRRGWRWATGLSPTCNGSRTRSSRRAVSRSSRLPFSVRTPVCRDGRGLTAPSAGQNRRRGRCLGSRSAARWASLPKGASTRIRDGESVLRDRVCAGGGWNYGNSNVFNKNLPAYIPTTAIALLALQDRQDEAFVRDSLTYLEKHAVEHPSTRALALSTLALRRHNRSTSLVEGALRTWLTNHPPSDVVSLGMALCALEKSARS